MDTDADGDLHGGGGRVKRLWVDERRDQRKAAADAAAPVDRISPLPEELRHRVLTLLPLKDAIRTGALARGWRDLWKSRWAQRSSAEIHLCSRDAARGELDALGREPRPRPRLDRFSLIAEEKACNLKSSELRRFVDYSVECRVEDLHVECRRRRRRGAAKLNFHLPLSSPLLARLFLRGLSVSSIYYKGAPPFRALEVIRLHSVCISLVAFCKMMAWCPSLRTLDMRGCYGDGLYSDRYVLWPANLRSVTIADSDMIPRVNMVRVLLVSSLRSFCYSSSALNAPFSLPGDATLADLYICFRCSISRSYYADLNKALPYDLCGLTVLTICSNTLKVASSLSDDGATALPKLCNLPSLRELQLLMLQMEAVNLADIYVFLKTCQCPNLERLFVQLPIFSDKPMEASLDEAGEELLPEVGLHNLVMVKVMNFNWRRVEVRLVSFLLRKVSSLAKLLLVSPNSTPPNVPGIKETDHLLIQEAFANGKIILRESDDAATQPYHSEVFLEI
ncbi:hypothetical protein ACP70R_043585 [Stipagrostis hirtigluma subsp. patula]